MDNGEKLKGRAGIPEGMKQDVDRLMDEVFYGDNSLKKSMAVALEKIENIEDNMATKTEIANIKWDLLKTLLPVLIGLLALLFAVLRWVES